MVDILFVGGSGDKSLTHTVEEALCRHFSASVCPGSHSLLPALPEDFLIHESPGNRWSYSHQSILLCKRQFSAPGPFPLSSSAVGLLSSDNSPAADYLKALGVNAVTCGMSVRDTLTFSSLEADSAVLCLQRSLTLLSGAVQEPFELPLSLPHGYDAYALLCLAGVCILGGKTEELPHIRL